jgi:acyl-CoA synthetase (AMP-forming)/AMP-acid ligase II
MRLHDALLYHAREQPQAEFVTQGARRLGPCEVEDTLLQHPAVADAAVRRDRGGVGGVLPRAAGGLQAAAFS